MPPPFTAYDDTQNESKLPCIKRYEDKCGMIEASFDIRISIKSLKM